MYKKGKYVLVIGAVVVVLLMVSSACAVNVVQSNNVKKSLKSESSDNEMDMYTYPEKLLESPYEIDINKMKMGEVKQLVQNEIFKNKNLLLKSFLILKVNRVFKTLYKIGINDETTISQAREIISENKEYVSNNAEGMNLLCSVSIDCGFGGTVLSPLPPFSQFFRPSAFVIWNAVGVIPAPCGSIKIVGLLGTQEDSNLYHSGNDYRGILLGYIGMIISGFLNPITPSISGFALFSTCR